MPSTTRTLKEVLAEHTLRGELWQCLPDGRIQCFACGHRCRIGEGHEGICRVRYVEKGELRVPWGYVGGLQLDPIEKKPFFHALPGAKALSFGMLGCDFHCAYCQNWFTSQSLRDSNATARPQSILPEEIVEMAMKAGAKVLTSTYNEPLITSEWAVGVFKVGQKNGLKTSYVSNGNGTPEVLEYIRPHVDLYKIDLKSFNDRHYRELGGVLENVLDTVRRVYSMGFWLEIVTLIVPSFNDGEDEIRQLCDFIASVSPDIPWHATAFHQDYKMLDKENTHVDTLLRSAEIGRKAGLRYVYVGNLPGRVGNWENTYCPSCGEELITRDGFKVLSNRLKDSHCPKCSEKIPGVWRADPC